jgi:IS5 family transposase
LGLTTNDKVPDEKSVCLFREKITKLGLDKELFDVFHARLEANGLIAHEGKIIDATFVEVPRVRNTHQENKYIKETGSAPQEWGPNKKRQKDVDASWTKKNNRTYFGYKNHIKSDNKHKLIDTYHVTQASVHDSQVLDKLLVEETDKNKPLWADSAYDGAPQKSIIKKYNIRNKVHEKGHRDKPLTESQKARNNEKSTVRARVEHFFGFIQNSMGGFNINSIGMARVSSAIGMVNLTYNLFRYEQIARLNGIAMA